MGPLHERVRQLRDLSACDVGDFGVPSTSPNAATIGPTMNSWTASPVFVTENAMVSPSWT